MKKTGRMKRLLAFLLTMAMLAVNLQVPAFGEAIDPHKTIVITIGADLNEDQRAFMLQYFGLTADQAEVIFVTNQDEREQIGGLISDEQIGNQTFSCSCVRPTETGGIQVKTVNMTYVTSNMIASTLATSGVYNCEVVTAAPMKVSGTGALTGVMIAYESASGEQIDPEKRELANEEIVITDEISDTVGQDQAILVVNDIKIHIVRDSITEQNDVNAVVDEVIATTEQAAYDAAMAAGTKAPEPLTQQDHQKLYNYGYKFSQGDYKYSSMQRTLERVTHNITKTTGIDDPITDTFTTLDEDVILDPDSILLGTKDEMLGEKAIKNATAAVALDDHEAEPIDVFTGEVTITESGGVKAEEFVRGTSVVSYKDLNGSYALMDLNGNQLTEAAFTNDFRGRWGHILATLDDGSGMMGLLETDGTVSIPFQYPRIEMLGKLWAAGVNLVPGGTEDDYDYRNYSDDSYYLIDTADIYYLDSNGARLAGTLTRDQIADYFAYDEYLNVEDRSGVVTAYDGDFTVLGNPESTYRRIYDKDQAYQDMIEAKTGYYVSDFYGGYARMYADTGRGVVDRYGNVIIPPNFNSIAYIMSGYDSDDSLYGGGYFGAELDGRFVFVTQGGNITGDFQVPYDDVYDYGMSARYEAEDGSFTILSGDGVQTNLGTTYEYLTSLYESHGMFYVGETSDWKYDLIDWHGNVLVSGTKGISMAGNGNYIIAETGYTSNTLYLVNDATPVDLASSAGGAVEVQAEVREGASLEAYTGEPQLEVIGNTLGANFAPGTNLVLASNDGTNYALMDLAGNQLTNPIYSRNMEEDSGWVIVQHPLGAGDQIPASGVTTQAGLLSAQGAEVIPCEYDHLRVLNENWAVAYHLSRTGTEDAHDFTDYNGGYFMIEDSTIFHLSETEVSSATLTRDQAVDIEAEDDYINIQDSSEKVLTYDSTFTPIASVDYIWDFDSVSGSNALVNRLEDQLGRSHYVNDSSFPDGYSRVADYNQDPAQEGVVDMNGEIIVPIEYDDVLLNYVSGRHIWNNGYFAVVKDGLAGFVTAGGEVTCELKYPEDNFTLMGVSASVKESDGSYTLVSADGTETTGLNYISAYGMGGNGKLVKVEDGSGNHVILDWHGNVVFENYYNVSLSGDGQFLILQEDPKEKPILYGVDGATVEGLEAPEAPAADEGTEETDADVEETEAPAPAPAEEPETEAPQQETSSSLPAPTEEVQTADPGAADNAETAGTSPAATLLDTAMTLINTDLEANRDAAAALLTSAKTILDAENPAAATIVNSAATLLTSGATDSTSIVTLLTTAQGML